MGEIRVLLVDSEAISRAGLRLLLSTREGISVVDEAENREEAVHKSGALAPDIVILNLDIPEVKTSELIRELRHCKGNARILGLGNDAEPEHILEALNAGMAGYLSKRARPDDLFGAIQAVYEEGAYLYPSVARLILENHVRRTEQTGRERVSPDGLSPREREVLKLIGRGMSSRQIADYLCLSVKTVERHAANIMDKLDVHRRTELVRYAIRTGLADVHLDAGLA